VRVLFVVLDGLADRPAAVLGGATPLEAAATPNLDSIVAGGCAGLIDPLGPGVAPGTDTSHFVFFGNPLEEYPGRALFEAAGSGLAVHEGEVALKGSFCEVERRGGMLHLVKRAIGMEAEDGAGDLVEAISKYDTGGYRLELVYTGGKESILYVRGGSCSAEITDSDPYADDRPVAAVEASGDPTEPEEASATAEAVTSYLRWAHERLETHPINLARREAGEPAANFLTTKWAARRRRLVSFSERYPFNAASVSTGVLFRGLCAELGITFKNVEYLADPCEDLARRVREGLTLLDSGFDFVHVHTKVIDQAAHKKDPELKRRVIESCDAGLAALAGGQPEDLLLVVTADHSTASSGHELLIHTGEPVPLAVRGRSVGKDEVKRFSERACASGFLGRSRASDLMPQALNWSDRTGYYGARMMRHSVLARPSTPEPFYFGDVP